MGTDQMSYVEKLVNLVLSLILARAEKSLDKCSETEGRAGVRPVEELASDGLRDALDLGWCEVDALLVAQVLPRLSEQTLLELLPVREHVDHRLLQIEVRVGLHDCGCKKT